MEGVVAAVTQTALRLLQLMLLTGGWAVLARAFTHQHLMLRLLSHAVTVTLFVHLGPTNTTAASANYIAHSTVTEARRQRLDPQRHQSHGGFWASAGATAVVAMHVLGPQHDPTCMNALFSYAVVGRSLEVVAYVGKLAGPVNRRWRGAYMRVLSGYVVALHVLTVALQAAVLLYLVAQTTQAMTVAQYLYVATFPCWAIAENRRVTETVLGNLKVV